MKLKSSMHSIADTKKRWSKQRSSPRDMAAPQMAFLKLDAARNVRTRRWVPAAARCHWPPQLPLAELQWRTAGSHSLPSGPCVGTGR